MKSDCNFFFKHLKQLSQGNNSVTRLAAHVVYSEYVNLYTVQPLLTMRLHIAPCLLCMSGVRRTCSVVTMASPISSQWEELEEPTPGKTISTHYNDSKPQLTEPEIKVLCQ